MKADTKNDQFDVIGLRLCEIRTIADLVSNSVDEHSDVAHGAFLIRRLASEATDALLGAIDEVNAEIAELKAAQEAARRAEKRASA